MKALTCSMTVRHHPAVLRAGRPSPRRALGAFALLVSALGCVAQSAPTADLDPEALTWVEYAEPAVGYRFSHPDLMTPMSQAASVLLRMPGHGVPALVRFTTEAEGRRRGAWFGHPAAAAATLAGRPAEIFDYTHWDGPVGDRTLAYVVPWRERWLALEFRTPGELSAVQQRILDSFTLDDRRR